MKTCKRGYQMTGPQNALLTVLMLSGLDGVTKPALSVRKAGK